MSPSQWALTYSAMDDKNMFSRSRIFEEIYILRVNKAKTLKIETLKDKQRSNRDPKTKNGPYKDPGP